MPVPWPTTRVYEQRTGPERNGPTRSASVGPAPSAYRLNGDVESQTSFARGANAVVTGTAIPDPTASVEVDSGPGLDGANTGGRDAVETQMSVFTFLKIVTALSALYMCTNPWFFFYDADKGKICPTTVLCATTPVELFLLTGSRVSAGVLFASLTISIFSKCYATRSYLHHSWLGAVLDFEPTHDVHTYFGYLTLVAALEHAILHCARFIYAKQAYLIYDTDTGRSGMVGCLLLLPIVLPMKFEFIRTKLSFQFRKGLHLMFLPLIVALCFHSVVFRFVGSILILWYLADRVYFTTKQTFLITHPVFEAVGRGTMVVLDLPEGYTFKAGSYIYVNSPTISRSEWHPFSIIQVPGKGSRAAFYAEAVGDWTRELFHLGLEQPRLPLWITAAQPSLMEKSIYYDNVVLVCTGAGITPAVSIIERFSKKKNIHLLLMSRDGGIVGLFEKQLRQVNSTVHVTGTQTEETKDALKRLLRPSTVNGARATKNESSRSIATNDFFTPRAAPNMIWEEADGGAGDETKGDHSDPDKLDERQRTQLAFSDELSLSTGSSQQPRRLSTLTIEPTRPVALVFGRPDIGAYLTETFAMQMETSRSTDESTLEQSVDKEAVPYPVSLSLREGINMAMIAWSSKTWDETNAKRSKRLDSDQQVSKEELMKADVNVVEDCQQKRTSSRANQLAWASPSPPSSAVHRRSLFTSTSRDMQVNVTNNGRNANAGSSTRPRPSSPLPWLVLYCGANPKVEEAIAHTCDELHVNWKKEYFGAW